MDASVADLLGLAGPPRLLRAPETALTDGLDDRADQLTVVPQDLGAEMTSSLCLLAVVLVPILMVLLTVG